MRARILPMLAMLLLLTACRPPPEATPVPAPASTPQPAPPAASPGVVESTAAVPRLSAPTVGGGLFDLAAHRGRWVVVNFWATWCGPCRMIAPILEEIDKTHGDKLQIAKLNVDENRAVPAKFGIRGIPTLMLFKGGELAATKVGALSKAQLTAFLDGHL